MIETAVSTPGKLILMGEHAVVYGRPALVAALEKRLRVTVSPLDTSTGEIDIQLPDLDHRERTSWGPVLEETERAATRWSEGERSGGNSPAELVRIALGEAHRVLDGAPLPSFELQVSSDLPIGSGFGSSAALAVSVIRAFLGFCEQEPDDATLHRLSLEVERRQHGTPSGVDNAAVIHGGVLWAERECESGTLCWSPLEHRSSLMDRLQVYHSGVPQESTGEVVAAVRDRISGRPSHYGPLLSTLGEVTSVFRSLLLDEEDEDPRMIRSVLRDYQRGLEELDVVPRPARDIVRAVEAAGGRPRSPGSRRSHRERRRRPSRLPSGSGATGHRGGAPFPRPGRGDPGGARRPHGGPRMTRTTVLAPANVAFVKYWGARDLGEAIPLAPSISMTLRACASRCTVEFEPDATGADQIHTDPSVDPVQANPAFVEKIQKHLDGLRETLGRPGRFRLATRNNFPGASGLASSASGFAALTIAATRAMGLELPPEELSVLARRSGSGSAARSVLGGYVEWPAEPGQDEAAARSLAPHEHWDLRDVIAIVEREAKEVPSREGHRRATTSPFFARRLEMLAGRLDEVRAAIETRDFERLGDVLETEAIELHLIAMSSVPPIFYWKPATLEVLEAVRHLRRDGVPAYSTMDAGANVHVICPAASEAAVAARLEELGGVVDVIRDGVGSGPMAETEHLF